jgi:hypothetical protein
VKSPTLECICSAALGNSHAVEQDESKHKSIHEKIREHLYEKAGLCCELCRSFALEQRRAHVDWED